MINLRYHIVSITAVFLALGIGVALGGTFLDRATVDLLEGNIGRAESRIRDTEARNDELTDLLRQADQRDDSLIEVGEVELFDGLLDETPVLIVTRTDSHPETVQRVAQALRRADADLQGVLELTDALLMLDEVDVDVANAVSVNPEDLDQVREAVDSTLRQVLIEAGRPDEADASDARPSGSDEDLDANPTTTTTATTSTTDPTDPNGRSDEETPDDDQSADDLVRPSIVTALLEASYLRFDAEPDVDEHTLLARPGLRYVIVGPAETSEDDQDLFSALLPEDESNALPAVIVGDLAGADGDAPPGLVAVLRDDRARGGLYSTVDNVGSFTGLTAMVLTVRDLEGPGRGHFGQAPGATAVLPSPGGP